MKLHWVHFDCLCTDWIDPAMGPAVFVFDDAERWSLKRVGFVYESLLEMPDVEIWRGPIVQTIGALARERGLESVVSVETPDPRLRAQGAALAVEWIAPEPFVALSGTVDLRRFSRYWRKAEPVLFHD